MFHFGDYSLQGIACCVASAGMRTVAIQLFRGHADGVAETMARDNAVRGHFLDGHKTTDTVTSRTNLRRTNYSE